MKKEHTTEYDDELYCKELDRDAYAFGAIMYTAVFGSMLIVFAIIFLLYKFGLYYFNIV